MTLFAENAKDNKCICESFIEKNKRVFDLEKENAELKMGLKWDADNRDELLKENAELRTKVTALENANRAMVKELDDTTSGGLSVLKNVVRSKEQLTKAKEIIKELLEFDFLPENEIKKQAEQFLSEVKND